MRFLETEDGQLIAVKHIVCIHGVNVRPGRSWHQADFVHGSEARTASCSAETIQNFLEGQDL